MNYTPAQVAEFDAFEDAIFSIADKIVGNGRASGLIKRYIRKNEFVCNKIGEFEKGIFVAMGEDGLIDAGMAENIFKKYFPKFADFITLPVENFRLKDLAEQIFREFLGGVI